MKKRTANECIDDLIKLERSRGWLHVLQYIDETIKDIEDQILTIDTQANQVQYTANDMAKNHRLNLKALRELPQKLQSDFAGQIETDDIDELIMPTIM